MSAPVLDLASHPAGRAPTRKLMTDRWATFDCYGTLIDWDGGVGDAMGSLWPAADRERMLRAYHGVEPLIQHARALPYREVLTRSLLAVAAVEGLPLEESRAGFLAESLPDWPAFPEVAAALTTLREGGWRLAVLSNTDPDLLDASLGRISVPVDLTVTALDARSYKPAHGHWKTFFDCSGASPERCVHVAASPFHDLAPAAALDLPAVWINRDRQSTDEPRAAELPDMGELPETLERLVPE